MGHTFSSHRPWLCQSHVDRCGKRGSLASARQYFCHVAQLPRSANFGPASGTAQLDRLLSCSLTETGGHQCRLLAIAFFWSRGVPFIFHTAGNVTAVPEEWAGVPLLAKPVPPGRLVSTLVSLATQSPLRSGWQRSACSCGAAVAVRVDTASLRHCESWLPAFQAGAAFRIL